MSNSNNDKESPASSNRDRTKQSSSWKVAKDLPSSFIFAAQGIKYSFWSQRNFRIHIFLGTSVISLALWLNIPPFNFAILTLTISLVLVLELINTSLEALVDLVIGRNFHPLARITKDCSAAAVLIASISSLVIAYLLLLPPLLIRLSN